MFKQAEKVIEKFGGHDRLAAVLGRDASSIYKWTYGRDKGGTNGLIPSSAMAEVMNAADVLGIKITAEDIDPRDEL